MNKEFFECVLKGNWKYQTPVKVVSMETVPATDKFIGFLSTITRYNLKVVLGNGRTVKKSLIVKTSPTDECFKEFNDKICTFKNEIMMYGLFKEMEYLMEEFQDYDDVLWCQMLHHIPYNCIVMEDLMAKGFNMVGKMDLFNLEESMIAINALGRYHGMCKALEERGFLRPQEFKYWYVFDDPTNRIYWGIISLVEGIKKLWDPSWIPIVDRIKITKESLMQRLKKLSELDETKFNLLNHGDCHKNNIIFKYDFNKQPIAVRFVDFQLVHYGSPCLDLTYFLHLAAQPSVRHDNFHILIRTYHNSLLNTLDKYQYKGNKPNIEEIIEGTNKYSFMGLVLFITGYPTLYMTEKMGQIKDMEKIVATDGKEGFSDELFKPELLEDAIAVDLKAFVEKFF